VTTIADCNSGDYVLVHQWFRISKAAKQSGSLLCRLAKHVNGELVEDNAQGREWYLPLGTEVLERKQPKPQRDEGRTEHQER